MSKYKIVAFDMDGTLLTTKQEISPRVKAAIDASVSNGNYVVACTGRSVMELSDYKEDFRNVRFYVCANGTYIYDTWEDKVIHSDSMDVELVKIILEVVKPEDTMIYMAIGPQNTLEIHDANRMEYFYADRYKDVELRTGYLVEDLHEYYRQNPQPVVKMNLYSRTAEIRDRLIEKLSPYPLEIILAEDTGIEVIKKGASKGVGYRILCDYLNIPMEQSIAVGDSDNDLEMLKVAGLSVAMENARDCVKSVSDIMVNDNDHDGCAEVLENYLDGKVV